MNNLAGKIALITGATSGIGEACAKRFAQAGAVVIVTGRNEERGRNVVKQINEGGGLAEFYRLSVDDDSLIEKTASLVKDTYGHIDILFNNAGIFPIAPRLEEMTRESIDDLFRTNTAGLLMMVSRFLPLISKGGCILNTASVAGVDAYTAGQSYAYCGTKAAVIKITKLLARRYGTTIRVNAIAPGVIKTPIFLNFDEERYKTVIPMNRTGSPEEVAAAANFLVSDDASFVNGAVLTVDGGQSA